MISVADVIYHTPYGDALVPLAPRTPKFLPEYRSVELSLHNWKLAGGNSPKLYISPETSRIVPMQLKAGTHVTFTPSSQLRGVGWGVVDTVDMSSTSTTNNFSTTMVRVTVHSWRLANNSYVTISCPANHLNPITPPSVTVLNPAQKIDRANMYRSLATPLFSRGEFHSAFKIYEAGLYIMNLISTDELECNHLRCGMLEGMVAMLNNSSMCALKCLDGMDPAAKENGKGADTVEGQRIFAQQAIQCGGNSVMLIDAVGNKRHGKVRALLLKKYKLTDIKLFGEWKLKALLQLARGLGEGMGDWQYGLKTLRTAEAVISSGLDAEADAKNKLNENWSDDERASLEKSFGRQLQKYLKGYSARLSAEQKKEKKRARAMFGGGSSGDSPAKKNPKNNRNSNSNSSSCSNGEEKKNNDNDISNKEKRRDKHKEDRKEVHAKKKVVKERRVEKEEKEEEGKKVEFKDPDSPRSFMEEHGELLLLSAGLGALVVAGTMLARTFKNKSIG